MTQSTDTTSSEETPRSAFANLLALSGYLGVAVGLSFEFYRLYLVDSILGVGSAPEWLEISRFALIASSIVAILYASILDEAFDGWLDLVLLCLLVGQWGVPVWLYVDATFGGPGSPYGFLVVVCAGLEALIGVIIALNYMRQCWPTVGAISALRSG